MEVAESAALGDLVAVVCVLTRLVPVGPLAQIVAAFPLAVLALRRPGRAGRLGVLTAGVVALLVGGVGPAGSAVSAGLFGWLVGVGARRGWGTARTAVTGVVTVAIPAGVVGVAALAIFRGYRALVLEQLGNAWSGAARLARGAGIPDSLVAVGDLAVRTAIEWWWVVLPVSVAVSTLIGLAITALLLARPLRAVRRLLPLDRAERLPAGGDGPVAPLPLRLRNVALPWGRRLDLDLEAGRFVVVTGVNGAGKSTLGRVLAGQAPSGGSVARPGEAGLGRVGGTGMIFQHPESQVLGVRAADDLRWGLPSRYPVPVEELLARVGLAGHGDTETATFSGGQLQRLAVAALLARQPAVVISDESTAMLDPEGRDQVTSLLRSLARGGGGAVADGGREGIAVVHITHRRTDGADEVVALGGADGEASAPARHGWGPPRPAAGGALRLRRVDVVHDPGTPWRRPVLAGVDLAIPAGATVLVTGPNGAGKTSLAWVLAGLSSPTRGTATLDGAPLRNGRGHVLLAVQHARPALLRPTVGEEVADAAGVGPRTADATLVALGLDPQLYRDRAIEELSGGEQRRVLLAGLLGAGPRALVLDEPLAGLDATATRAVHDALAAARAAGITLVVTTHDPAPLIDLADATVRVAEGTLDGPPGIVGAPHAAEPGRERRGRAASGVLRTVPGSSPLHRLWAGTKVAALLAVALTLAIDPSWSTLAGAAAVLLAGAIAAQLPLRAAPRPPRWLLLWLLPAVLATVGTRPPLIHVGGTLLSLGGLEGLVLLLGTTLVSLLGTALLVATTPLGAFPPLLQRLARRSGPHTAISTITLGLRLMPLLLVERRTTWLLLGQRRHVERVPTRPREQVRRGVRTALLACSTAVRRAGDMGEAINARGGFGAVSGPDQRPDHRDLLAAAVVVAILAVALAV